MTTLVQLLCYCSYFLLIGRKQSYVHFQVGSGKSSLLNSIIGEMSVLSGSIKSCGSIAYVPQVVLYDLEMA